MLILGQYYKRSRISNRLVVTNNLVAMGAGVLLVIACGDAEGNETTSEPASNNANHDAENPGEGTLV